MKGAIITIDAVPFRQWYEAHYALPLARKKGQKLTEEEEARIGGAQSERKILLRNMKSAKKPRQLSHI